MKKTIGIPGYLISGSANHFGAGVNYLEWISKFGNPRIIMPWEEFVDVDLLVLPGGLDLHPSNYGEVPRFQTSNTDVFKEFFFRQRLKTYIDKGIPVFGICLGMQQLAAYFGCKLKQDMLHHAQSPDRWETAHNLFKIKDNKYIVDKSIAVNSHHHQCVPVATLSDKVEPIYFSKDEEEFFVEAFKVKDMNIFGVQWHPEELYDKFTTETIKNLLS